MNKKSSLLTDREFVITSKETGGRRVTWFSPKQYLEEKFSSVVRVELVDTTSSSGDWSGFFLQRLGRSVVAISFSQENCMGGRFVLNTGKMFASAPFRDREGFVDAAKDLFCGL